MTKSLQTMISYYRDLGMRVDEVLFQEVNKSIKIVHDLEEELKTVLDEGRMFTNKQYSELRKQNAHYREAMEEAKEISSCCGLTAGSILEEALEKEQ